MVDALHAVQYETIVIPYYGYARQDRQSTISWTNHSKMVQTITQAGADRVLTLGYTLPNSKFFDVPVDLIRSSTSCEPLLRKQLQDKDIVVVSPDHSRCSCA